MDSWSLTMHAGPLTFRMWKTSLPAWAESCAPAPLPLPSLIAGCQVELEGTGRLSGPSESHIASGSKHISLHRLLLAVHTLPVSVASASGQLILSHGGEHRALASAQLYMADPAHC